MLPPPLSPSAFNHSQVSHIPKKRKRSVTVSDSSWRTAANYSLAPKKYHRVWGGPHLVGIPMSCTGEQSPSAHRGPLKPYFALPKNSGILPHCCAVCTHWVGANNWLSLLISLMVCLSPCTVPELPITWCTIVKLQQLLMGWHSWHSTRGGRKLYKSLFFPRKTVLPLASWLSLCTYQWQSALRAAGGHQAPSQRQRGFPISWALAAL